MTTRTCVSRRGLVRTINGITAAIGLAGCVGSSKPNESDQDPGSNSEDGSADTAEFRDFTSENTVTVDVGGTDGLSFAPADILISTGTTVIWEWTEQGGEHNVIETEGVFKSHEDGGTTNEAGYTFSYTFDQAGTYDYECIPHREVGMVGTVRVE